MKIISITNHKGGVGKSVTSLAFAENLFLEGYKVLLIDLDQQINTTKVTLTNTSDVVTAYDLLTSLNYKTKDGIQNWEYGDVIAGDKLIGEAEAVLSRFDSPLTMLEDALDQVKKDYDYIIIDCPPSLGYITRNALVASDEIIIVANPDVTSVDGFAHIYTVVDQIVSNRHLNPDLKIAGILINKYDKRGKLDRQIDEQLPKLLKNKNTSVFNSRIRKCVKVSQAMSANVPLVNYDPKCAASIDFNLFTKEYLKKN